LKDGLGAIPASRKPLAGTKPSGDDLMQIVPPVMIMSTRASGYGVAMVAAGVPVVAALTGWAPAIR